MLGMHVFLEICKYEDMTRHRNEFLIDILKRYALQSKYSQKI